MKTTMKYIYSGLLVLTSLSLSAQTGTMVTAVPSLSIAPDARGGGMGDVGAATLPDFTLSTGILQNMLFLRVRPE